MLSNDLQHEDNSSEANDIFIESIKADPEPESDQDSKQNDGIETKKCKLSWYYFQPKTYLPWFSVQYPVCAMT